VVLNTGQELKSVFCCK